MVRSWSSCGAAAARARAPLGSRATGGTAPARPTRRAAPPGTACCSPCAPWSRCARTGPRRRPRWHRRAPPPRGRGWTGILLLAPSAAARPPSGASHRAEDPRAAQADVAHPAEQGPPSLAHLDEQVAGEAFLLARGDGVAALLFDLPEQPGVGELDPHPGLPALARRHALDAGEYGAAQRAHLLVGTEGEPHHHPRAARQRCLAVPVEEEGAALDDVQVGMQLRDVAEAVPKVGRAGFH